MTERALTQPVTSLPVAEPTLVRAALARGLGLHAWWLACLLPAVVLVVAAVTS